MVAITICNDFGAQENKICHCFHFFPFYLPLSDRTGSNGEFQASFFIVCFHPHQEALSFFFTLCRYSGIICISEVVDIHPRKLDSSWCFIQPDILCDVDCKKIQPVHPKGDQSWVFIGRTDAEAETPIFWPSDAKNWLIGKDPDAGRDWGQEEKGTPEEEMAGWHHRLDGHEFE